MIDGVGGGDGFWEGWQDDLERWLELFLAGLAHPARRRMCPLYVAGLIGPGDRKSVQPMAARSGAVGYDQLHHFVAAGVWDRAPLEAALLKEADRLVGDERGFLVIDDTALPKSRTISSQLSRITVVLIGRPISDSSAG